MQESDRVRRVLMTADAVGGVWTYALELAAALARGGRETAIATMGRRLRPDQREECGRVAGLQVFESAYRLEWEDDPWRDVADAGRWLLALERRLRPDVVHLNGYAHAALPWRAPRLVVAHSCVLTWWEAVEGGSAPSRYDRYRFEVGRGLRAADALVAPTQAMADAVRRSHGLERECVVIPNGLAPDRFASAATPKEPIVLAAGRLWDRAKNLAVLEAAAPRLPWPAYAAGCGSEGGSPAPSQPEGGLNHLGWLPADALRSWMGRAAVFVAPARYEPFGLGILEAALSGCCLVLGDVASLRELWSGAALFVPPDDGDALVTAVGRLAGDDALRGSLSVAARERGLSLSAERMAHGYAALYERLAGALRVNAQQVARSATQPTPRGAP